MYGAEPALPEERTVPDSYYPYMQIMAYICHTHPEHRQDAEPESVHPKHSREICSSMVAVRASTMWQSISEMVRLFMQVHLLPESRFPMHIIVHQYVLSVY